MINLFFLMLLLNHICNLFDTVQQINFQSTFIAGFRVRCMELFIFYYDYYNN